MEHIVRKVPTDAQKRMVAGRQSYKCANCPNTTIRGIETYNCPLWQRAIEDNKGSFDQSGFELDHINELAISGDNSLDNFQALCKSCHSVKTKKFLMKKTNNAYHPVYGKYIAKQEKHYIYLADSHVVTLQSKIWSKNRPCDKLRVSEIEKYITEMGYVDGILYFANIEGEGLVCYDGNHRRCALLNLTKSYKILINVLENPSPEYLKNKFISLNKCVPVTDLFLNDTHSKAEVDLIMEVTEHFCKLWKSHRKTSPNPNRPNFNRDTLQSKISSIIELNSIDISNSSKDDIIQQVNRFNEEINNKKDSIKSTKTMLNKCIASGCFLFLEKTA